LITTSCSEVNEQPGTAPSNSNSSALSKNAETAAIPNAQFGKLGLVGKIFSKDEADIIFGKVKSSLTISVDELNAAIDKGNQYILFAIKDGQIVIRNEKRQHLSNERVNLKQDETLYLVSKSMVKELLKAKKSSLSLAKSTAAAVAVELRDGVLTLSYYDQTLEQFAACPPICAV
jgi:ribosomal protein L27